MQNNDDSYDEQFKLLTQVTCAIIASGKVGLRKDYDFYPYQIVLQAFEILVNVQKALNPECQVVDLRNLQHHLKPESQNFSGSLSPTTKSPSSSDSAQKPSNGCETDSFVQK